KARPPCAGLVLVERAEQWLSGDNVYIDPGLVVVPVLVPKRRFGRVALGDGELDRRENLAELGIALLERAVRHPRRHSSLCLHRGGSDSGRENQLGDRKLNQ